MKKPEEIHGKAATLYNYTTIACTYCSFKLKNYKWIDS